MDEENVDYIENLDDLDSALDDLTNPTEPVGDTTPAPDDSTAGEPADEGTQTGETSSGATPAEGTTPAEGAEVVDANTTKANKAFAEQRIQNKMMSQALEKILSKAGLDPTLARNPQAVLKMFEDADIADQAQQMNIPAQLLSRINALESQTRAQEEQRLYNAAVSGFQTVKDKYNLSTTELNQFASQLQEAGINPFVTEIDFDREYKMHNLDKIIENERKAAAKEALAKQTKATQHSTVPPRANGKPAEVDDGEKINTMAQFDVLLSKMK